MFFIFRFAFLARAFLMKPRSQRGTSRKKPSLNDFDFTTNSQTRTVPELFGRAKLSGNLIYRGNLKSYPITEDGGKKRGDFITGYRNHMSFRLSFCKNRDMLHSVFLNNKNIANLEKNKRFYFFHVPSSISQLSNSKQIQTGISSRISGSNYGKNTVEFFCGNQRGMANFRGSSIGYTSSALASLTGKRLFYKNTCYRVFDNRFIGDNVTRLPEYKFVFENGFYGKVQEDYWNNKDELGYGSILDSKYYFYHDSDGNLHPFEILDYLFHEYLDKDFGFLDYSQEDYDYLTTTEPICLSFLMTSSKKLIDWVKEILRHIDAVMFYNYYTKKLEIKLIRKDYDINLINSINESNYKNLKVIRKDYKDIKNKVTLNYTHPTTYEETSISFVNEANSINSEQEEEYDFNMIRNHEYAKTILKRLIKKECYPLTTFKFSLSRDYVEGTNDYNIKPGTVLKLNNNKLGLTDFAIRVLELERGKEDENLYDIVATEDIFDTSSFDTLNFEVNEEGYISYDLNDLDVNNILVIDTPRELTSLNNDGVITIIREDETDGEIVNGYIRQDGLTGNRKNITIKGSYRQVRRDFITDGKILDYNSELLVNNRINLHAFTRTEVNFQRLKYYGIFDDGEVVGIKQIIDNEDGTWTIKGFIRGIAETEITNKTAGQGFYLVIDGTVINNLKSLSILPRQNKTIYFNKYNNVSNGDKVSKNHTYNYTLRKPYKPRNVKYTIDGTDTIINWGRRRRLAGRNYRSPEIFVAGEEEGTNEENIKYIINYNNDTEIFETSDLTLTIPYNSGSFTIKRQIGRYFSEEETINII